MLLHTFLVKYTGTSHLANETLVIQSQKNPFIVMRRVIYANLILNVFIDVGLSFTDNSTVMAIPISVVIFKHGL